MIIETARVIAYQQGIATVQCYAKSGCGSCAAQAHCGTTALSALAGERHAPQFQLETHESLAVGDQVEIGLEEQRLLMSIFWLYGVPLLTLLGSTLFFSYWIEQELWVALLVVLSTLGAFAAIKRILSYRTMQGFKPVFVRKI